LGVGGIGREGRGEAGVDEGGCGSERESVTA
jgi:hypothetical protein